MPYEGIDQGVIVKERGKRVKKAGTEKIQ